MNYHLEKTVQEEEDISDSQVDAIQTTHETIHPRFTQLDRDFLEQTFELAILAYRNHEVPVGCVFVYGESTVIGRGRNEVNKLGTTLVRFIRTRGLTFRSKNPTRHAEFVAIEEAERWCIENHKDFTEARQSTESLHINQIKVMKETTLYVTLEPCIMCASALYQLNVRRLVFGASNPRFGGIKSVASNRDYGHAHKIDVDFLNKSTFLIVE